MKSISKRLGEIDARHLLGDRVLHPAFLNQRNQQRASLFAGRSPRVSRAL